MVRSETTFSLANSCIRSSTVACRFIFATLAVVVGSIIYRLVIQFALQAGFDPNDMKLVSAVLVIFALMFPRLGVMRRVRAHRKASLMAAVQKGDVRA